MIPRRRFIGLLVGGIAACSTKGGTGQAPDARPTPGSSPDAGADASSSSSLDAGDLDSCEGVQTIELYDCNAQALYLDETLGPLTGVILVEQIVAGQPLTFDFWHGHGGQLHAFTVETEHFEQLRRGERTFVTTTEVDSHQHTLFIDPVDPSYRVEGALPVLVTVVACED